MDTGTFPLLKFSHLDEGAPVFYMENMLQDLCQISDFDGIQWNPWMQIKFVT